MKRNVCELPVELLEFLNGDLPQGDTGDTVDDHDPQCGRGVRLLARFQGHHLMDGLVAGFRSIVNLSEGTYRDISVNRSRYQSTETPQFLFCFGPHTHKVINVPVPQATHCELVKLIASQILLQSFVATLSPATYWFRDYVFGLKDKPIFILCSATKEQALEEINDYIQVIPVYPLLGNKCLDRMSKYVTPAIDSLEVKVPREVTAGPRYLEYVRSLWNELAPKLGNISFTDSDLDQSWLRKQVDICADLLSRDGMKPHDGNVDAHSLARFLASTHLLQMEWGVNYYVPARLTNHPKESGYSLFFGQRKKPDEERRLIQMWRLAANLDSIEPTLRMAQNFTIRDSGTHTIEWKGRRYTFNRHQSLAYNILKTAKMGEWVNWYDVKSKIPKLSGDSAKPSKLFKRTGDNSAYDDGLIKKHKTKQSFYCLADPPASEIADKSGS